MAQSINLIPKEEQVEQQKQKVVKLSSVVAVFMLLIAISISGYFYNIQSKLHTQLKSHKAQIEDLRTQISAAKDIEVSARTLDARYKMLKGVYDSRILYSDLLVEIRKRIPVGVNLESFSLSTGVDNKLNMVSLSGNANDYNAVARFIETLSDKNFRDANEKYKGLLTDVSLNSVTLDAAGSQVKFFLVVTYDPALLN